MTALGRIALDDEEVPVPADGDDWRLAWHPPPSPPSTSDLAGQLWIEPGAGPIYARAAHEAALPQPD